MFARALKNIWASSQRLTVADQAILEDLFLDMKEYNSLGGQAIADPTVEILSIATPDHNTFKRPERKTYGTYISLSHY